MVVGLYSFVLRSSMHLMLKLAGCDWLLLLLSKRLMNDSSFCCLTSESDEKNEADVDEEDDEEADDGDDGEEDVDGMNFV